MSEEERVDWFVDQALRAELKDLALALLESLDEQDFPTSIIADDLEALTKWLPVLRSVDVTKAFWEKILEVGKDQFWQVIEANLGAAGDALPSILGALKGAGKLTGFLEHWAVLLGRIPPEEEEAAEEVEEVTAEPEPAESVEGTSLEELGLSDRVYNVLKRSSRTLLGAAGVVEDDRVTLYVEDVLAILKSGAKRMSGEDFLLSGYVRNFGPVSLKELKTALQERGFLPAEEAKEE